MDRLSCLHFLMPKQGWGGEVRGCGKNIMLFFFLFVLINVRHLHICMFDHVLLELAWVDSSFSM